MLFLAVFLLLISFSSSLLFPLNQCLCFFIAVLSFSLDNLCAIDFKLFGFSFKVPTWISASLFFREASWSSLALLILIELVASILIDILSVFILHLTRSLVVDLIITWSVLVLASLIALVFRKSGRSYDDVVNEVLVFGSLVNPRVLVDLLVWSRCL